jgi:predicted DNA-binding protein (MmcQ/YjbR family)
MAYAMTLPMATEDEKWGNHIVHCVFAKMFTIFDIDDASTAFRFKCDEDDFERLCEIEGIAPSSYIGRYGWVQVDRSDILLMAESKALLTKSHRLVVEKLSKRRQREVFG